MANSKTISIIDYQNNALRHEIYAILDERENTLRHDLYIALQAATKAQQTELRAVLEPLIGKVEAALADKQEG